MLPTEIVLVSDDSVAENAPRNYAAFYRLRLIEAYGTGIPKIMNVCAGTELKPKIEVSSNVFKITLPDRTLKRMTVDFDETTGSLM